MHFSVGDYVCAKVVVGQFKRLALQLTSQTCELLSRQWMSGEIPGIPPHKNRTDHGVASGSSVSDATGGWGGGSSLAQHTQARVQNGAEVDARARQTGRAAPARVKVSELLSKKTTTRKRAHVRLVFKAFSFFCLAAAGKT